MSDNEHRKPYAAPQTPRVVSTLALSSATFTYAGTDSGFYASVT